MEYLTEFPTLEEREGILGIFHLGMGILIIIHHN